MQKECLFCAVFFNVHRESGEIVTYRDTARNRFIAVVGTIVLEVIKRCQTLVHGSLYLRK